MTATRPARIRPGLYELTIDVDGAPVTFTIERTDRGDTAYASDIGLWSISRPGDPGAPWYRTLHEALAVLTPDRWYRDPRYGVCARGLDGFFTRRLTD